MNNQEVYNILYAAIQNGDFNLVKQVVQDEQLDVNVSKKSGVIPLMIACSCLKDRVEDVDSTRIVQFLLSQGADAFRLDNAHKNCLAYVRSCNRNGILTLKNILQENGVIDHRKNYEKFSPVLDRKRINIKMKYSSQLSIEEELI